MNNMEKIAKTRSTAMIILIIRYSRLAMLVWSERESP